MDERRSRWTWIAAAAAATRAAAAAALVEIRRRVRARRPAGPVEPTAQERAEERMYAVRYASLKERTDALQTAHDALAACAVRDRAAAAEATERATSLERDLAAARAQSVETAPRAPASSCDADALAAAAVRIDELEREVVRLTQAGAHAERARTAGSDAAAAHYERLAAVLRPLAARADSAEEAVRTALREFGVDPSDWPLTVDGVVRAAGPLTLLALGEDTPGWSAEPADDTLAAAIVHLRRRAGHVGYAESAATGAFENGRL